MLRKSARPALYNDISTLPNHQIDGQNCVADRSTYLLKLVLAAKGRD
jgi:hypothetical protein